MKGSFRLYERFGVELEYMIVDAETLDIRPEADRLIEDVAGSVDGDVSRGRLEWSNELSLHVLELKTARPALHLDGLDRAFQREIRYINHRLKKSGARLLPTAMHPWMNPATESRLWPHGNREIYAAFDRIFGCAGHGWTNLQSVHLNLPFRSEMDFRRLHSAVRLLLPVLPALAASSPFIEGRPAPFLDMRLEAYRQNCRRIPSITGRVVPERIRSSAEYRERILRRIHRDLAPLDRDRLLQEEWANARGAIARFERNTIEIRVLDIQECPAADLAILQFIVALLRGLTGESLSSLAAQERPGTRALEGIFLEVIRQAGAARIEECGYLRALGLDSVSGLKARELLRHLFAAVTPAKAAWRDTIEFILEEGSLAERLRRGAGRRPAQGRLRDLYGRLANCLESGELFHV